MAARYGLGLHHSRIMTIHVKSTPSKGAQVLLEKYLVALVLQISDLVSFLLSLLLFPCQLWQHFEVFNHD